jgi:hypothetical protein
MYSLHVGYVSGRLEVRRNFQRQVGRRSTRTPRNVTEQWVDTFFHPLHPGIKILLLWSTTTTMTRQE